MPFRKNRANNELRKFEFIPNYIPNSYASCLVSFGNTRVLCTANVSTMLPFFVKHDNMNNNTSKGWISAEYGMLPGSTASRNQREAKMGKQSGRTQEIQRLIARSLRAVLDLSDLNKHQIIIDCDVISADGGTRTTAINGAYIVLFLALQKMYNEHKISKLPLKSEVAAISCGIKNNDVYVDLNYKEDSNIDVDANFVMSGKEELIEVQMTGEQNTFSVDKMLEMTQEAQGAIKTIIAAQRDILLSLK